MQSEVLHTDRDHVEVCCFCGQNSLNSLGKGVVQYRVCIIHKAQGSMSNTKKIYLHIP